VDVPVLPFQAIAKTAMVMAALPSGAVPLPAGLALQATSGVDMRTVLVDFVPPRCGASPVNSTQHPSLEEEATRVALESSKLEKIKD
jgi:hypothetical protein